MPTLEFVEIAPTLPATHSVIWLHGLGADGHDFTGIVPELRLPASAAIRFIFPHAPHRPVTLNSGITMRAWYDLYALDNHMLEDELGIREAYAYISELIEHENARGIDFKNIILAGFSQGGALALFSGLRYPKQLAGIMALSTYLPLQATLAKEGHAANKNIPIMMAHGVMDPIVPLVFARASRIILTSLHYQVEWHEYPMAHSVCADEVREISDWLMKVCEHSS
jgi:phospholipase/carboxylesterase